MEILTPTKDMHSIGLIDELRPLRTHAEFVDQVLEIIASLVPCDMASYNEIPSMIPAGAREPAHASVVAWTPSAPTGGLSVDDQLELSWRFIHEHPAGSRGARVLFRNSDLCPRSAWRRTCLYNELHRPLGMEFQCSVVLPAPRGRDLGLSYSRKCSDFSDDDLLHLRLAQDRLNRIFHDHWHYLALVNEREQWRHMGESDGLGFMRISPDGHVVWMGDRARSLLEESGLSSTGGVLPPVLRRWLEPFVHGATTLASLRVPVDRRVIVVALHQDDEPGTGAMLSVSEQSRATVDDREAIHVVAEHFDLSLRQAEVALWISRGKTNRDIATILSIKPATVKKHAERIFIRLGVENRTSAAQSVHELLPPTQTSRSCRAGALGR